MSLPFLLLVAFLSASCGAPLTDSTVPTTIGFAPSCASSIHTRDLSDAGNNRTALDIVWACVATIFACIWVSIHPNLPSPRESGFQRFRRKVLTMIIAIIAPELIALWAMRQWFGARELKRKFNDKFHGGVDPELSLIEKFKQWFTGPPAKPKPGWTLTHGFFVQMGGFMIYDEENLVMVLTFERLMRAIDKGEIEVPNVPEEDIMDKSKGDLLSKLIVVVQTTWFVIQCIGRWHSNLPLAELEVLTLAFAVLNIFVYGIWWSKPQSVTVPIKLALRRRTRDVAISATRPPPQLSSSPSFHPPSFADEGSNAGLDPTISHSSVGVHVATRVTGTNGDSLHLQVRLDPEDAGEIYDKQSFHWFRRKFRNVSTFKAMSKLKLFLFSLTLLPRVCLRTTQYLLVLYYRTTGPTSSKTPFTETSRGEEFAVGRDRVPMFYAELIPHDLTLIRTFGGVVIPVIFGALHLTLWSAPFRTQLERLIWRISAVYITAVPFVLTGTVFIIEATDDMNLAGAVGGMISFLLLCLYPVARYILFYISLASLFHLTEGVYRDVQWTQILPHV